MAPVVATHVSWHRTGLDRGKADARDLQHHLLRALRSLKYREVQRIGGRVRLYNVILSKILIIRARIIIPRDCQASMTSCSFCPFNLQIDWLFFGVPPISDAAGPPKRRISQFRRDVISSPRFKGQIQFRTLVIRLFRLAELSLHVLLRAANNPKSPQYRDNSIDSKDGTKAAARWLFPQFSLSISRIITRGHFTRVYTVPTELS